MWELAYFDFKGLSEDDYRAYRKFINDVRALNLRGVDSHDPAYTEMARDFARRFPSCGASEQQEGHGHDA